MRDPLQLLRRSRLRADRPDAPEVVGVVEVAQIDHAGPQPRQPTLEQPQRHADGLLAAAEGEDDRVRAWPLHHLQVAAEIVAEPRRRLHGLGQEVDKVQHAVGPLQLRLLFAQRGQGAARDLQPPTGQQLVDRLDPVHRIDGRELRRRAAGVGPGQAETEFRERGP